MSGNGQARSHRDPSLAPGSETRLRGVGSLWRITQWLDAHAGPFAVSGLISSTGIKLRDFGPASPDDDVLLERLGQALRQAVSAKAWEQLRRFLPER